MAVTMNVKVDDYTSRVLGVIKEKFGLKDKSEALNKFADLCGEDFVEREVRDEVVNDVIRSCEAHIKKHGYKCMSEGELKKLFEIE